MLLLQYSSWHKPPQQSPAFGTERLREQALLNSPVNGSGKDNKHSVPIVHVPASHVTLASPATEVSQSAGEESRSIILSIAAVPCSPLTCVQVNCCERHRLPHHQATRGFSPPELLHATLHQLHFLSSRPLPERSPVGARYSSNEGTWRG